MNNDSKHKKAKGTKKCVIKIKLMFKNYKDCQSKNEIILKWQQRLTQCILKVTNTMHILNKSIRLH